MGKLADQMREYVKAWRDTPKLMDDLDAGDVDAILEDFMGIADQIDRDHEIRMEQCRRETKRATLHYIRSCANDYERGVKRVRKQ